MTLGICDTFCLSRFKPCSGFSVSRILSELRKNNISNVVVHDPFFPPVASSVDYNFFDLYRESGDQGSGK